MYRFYLKKKKPDKKVRTHVRLTINWAFESLSIKAEDGQENKS